MKIAAFWGAVIWTSFVFSQEPTPWPSLKPATNQAPLPGTKPLTLAGDLSFLQAEGWDKFLDQQIDIAAKNRPKPKRENLSKLLGLHRETRPEKNRLEFYSLQNQPRAIAESLEIHHVRWLAFGDVHGDGLLLVPRGKPVLADVIAIPDADQTPEEISSLAESENPFALNLARMGCRVLVPTLIDREENQFRMTNREWLHRPAFELGRTLIGYELHKIFAGIDALTNTQNEARKLGIVGHGEGGLLALYAAALDERIETAAVSGYFGKREMLWNETADHNIFGLVRDFGDAEIASLVSPRFLFLIEDTPPTAGFRLEENGQPQRHTERAKKAGKPGKFIGGANFEAEVKRLENLGVAKTEFIASDRKLADELAAFVQLLTRQEKEQPVAEFIFDNINDDPPGHDSVAERQAAQQEEIRRHNQLVLVNAAAERDAYFKNLDTGSLEKFQETIEPFREKFRTEVIGDFELERLPPNARTRKFQEGEKTISYEVVLDVFDGTIAYGILTLPKKLNLKSGEKRPVVVCQHGLEGSPQDVIGEPKFKAYQAFATRLAERGFITFAPQNNYKYFDLFRIQQFKAQSIGKTLFSTIIPCHRQITDWLAEQPFVDPERIGFYGLSYGGKSAMRIPPLVERYSLSICSADFNDWVWKNAATDPRSLRYSYANKGEYEIFEWDLGGTFNYSEMAALIAPRPFMVERGHFDGVAPDERVGLEFAKVRFLYQAKLGLGDRCEIEWFIGPHSINGQAAYDFLHRHLDWPKPNSE